jgi:hypothetical protein
LNQDIRTLDGVAKAARYAFGPNKLHLCGPDANREVFAYLKEGASDAGLGNILKGFHTLYPYLKQIAAANRIRDPFDIRVVEAYWIGNELLETISVKTFYRHLTETLHLKDRYDQKSFHELAGKLPKGARMHHTFHVLNAYKRTGHDAKLHTLESMDACRVSWGKVEKVDGISITVRRKPLLVRGHHLVLGEPAAATIQRKLEDDFLENLRPGQWLTMHWHVPCEVISEQNVRALEHYTKIAVALSNETL